MSGIKKPGPKNQKTVQIFGFPLLVCGHFIIPLVSWVEAIKVMAQRPEPMLGQLRVDSDLRLMRMYTRHLICYNQSDITRLTSISHYSYHFELGGDSM